MKRFKDVLSDLYYRAICLPLLIRLWVVILWWRYRIEKQCYKFFKTRAALDHIWQSSEQLAGQKRIKLEKKLRKLEKDFLVAEEDIKKYEEECLIKKEFFNRYWQKITDPHIGE